jgi:hypothetical protein
MNNNCFNPSNMEEMIFEDLSHGVKGRKIIQSISRKISGGE